MNKTIPRMTKITTPNKVVPIPIATPKVKKLPPDEPLAEEDEAGLFISGWVGGGENSMAGGADLSGGMKGLSFWSGGCIGLPRGAVPLMK